MSNFGTVARARRRALDITIQTVAKAIGRSPFYVCSVERGYIEGSPADRAAIEAFLRERERPLPIRRSSPRLKVDHAAR